MKIPKHLISGYSGLYYSYCVIINNDVQHPVNEYFYNSMKWEEGQKRVLTSRDGLSGKKGKKVRRIRILMKLDIKDYIIMFMENM